MKNINPVLLEDLTDEEINQIERRMRPGKASHAGFLGSNEKLREVIATDDATLEKYGITHKQVGDRLDSLMGQGFWQWALASKVGEDYYEARGNGALIDGKYSVTAIGWMGSQECPFSNGDSACGYGSHDFTITNETTGEQIHFPQLMAHLVREHHFFEGHSSYRLNPEEAIKVLDLKPGQDYTPKTATETIWKSGASSSEIDKDFCGSGAIIKDATRVIDISPKVKIYISGDKCVVVAKESLELAEPFKIDGHEIDFYHGHVYRGINIFTKTDIEYIVG